jgi:hypothetical protein
MSDELINLIDEILCGLYTENTNKCVVKYKFGKKKRFWFEIYYN